MFTIKIFTDNNDIKTLETLGAFTVIEYQRDLSVMPGDAMLAYYCNEMNVRKSFSICKFHLHSLFLHIRSKAAATDRCRCSQSQLNRTINFQSVHVDCVNDENTYCLCFFLENQIQLLDMACSSLLSWHIANIAPAVFSPPIDNRLIISDAV